MTPAREPLPDVEDWAARLDLRNRSGEYVGPCPVCGGEDRFHVGHGRGGAAMVGCRGCIDGQPPKEKGEAFGRILRETFPERFQSGAGENLRANGNDFGAPSRSRRTGPAPSSKPPRKPPESRSEPISAPDPGEDARPRLVRALWAAAAPADDSPGRVYLAWRRAWPPAGTGPNLPASVRWLDDGDPDRDPAAKWYGLPRGAAGALVFAWWPSTNADPNADPVAVSLEALDAGGERPDQAGTGKRWRRTVGRRTGAVFEARAARGEDTPVHVAEGEVSALALALAPWCGPGAVVAAGGTPGLRRAGELAGASVVLHADGDGDGRGAVERARRAIEASGRSCSIAWYAIGADPTDALGEWLTERAAIREFDGGEARAEADRGAWTDLLAANGGTNDEPA